MSDTDVTISKAILAIIEKYFTNLLNAYNSLPDNANNKLEIYYKMFAVYDIIRMLNSELGINTEQFGSYDEWLKKA